MRARVSEAIPPTEVVDDPSGGQTEYYDLPLSPPAWAFPNGKVLRLEAMEGRTSEELGVLLSVLKDLFVDHWDKIRFGPCIEGAVYELELREQPTQFSLLDGYLTVVFPPGPAHFHLCVGTHRGLGKNRTPEALAKVRQCARASLYRSVDRTTCTPGSWGLRLWNGAGEQMLTVFLPSPYLDDNLKRINPDWSRLSLWNSLRAKYLGETEPQPLPEHVASVDHR